MNTGEIDKYLPGPLRRLFPVKARNFPDFVSLAAKQGAIEVRGEQIVRRKTDFFTADVVALNPLEHSARYTSEAPRRRPVVFTEPYEISYKEKYGLDLEDATRLRGLVTIDDRLQRVRSSVPFVTLSLVGPEGDVDQDYETISLALLEARRLEITPYPLNETGGKGISK